MKFKPCWIKPAFARASLARTAIATKHWRYLSAIFFLALFLPTQVNAGPLDISGDWRVHSGDDMSWAQPDFDDSSWATRPVPGAWELADFSDQNQFAWYRTRINVNALTSPDVLIGIQLGPIRNAYEIYINGKLQGGVGKLPPDPVVNYDKIGIYPVSTDLINQSGELVLAIRIWGGSDLAVKATGGGPYAGAFVAGDYALLLRDYDAAQTPKLIFLTLFFLVGIYFLYLYLRNRDLTPFLWFGLTSLTLAPYILTQSDFKYQLGLSFIALEKLESISLFLFLIMMTQLVWSVLERPANWLLRGYQLYFGALALLFLTIPGLDIHYQLRPFWQFGSLASVVPLLYVILVEIQQKNRDARTLGIGLLIFMLTALNDLAINLQLFDSILLMPLGFLAILVSMGILLANKFTVLVDRLEQEVADRTEELSEVNKQLEKANKSLTEMTRIDPLTGLLNRRGFEDEAKIERQRFLRRKEPLALAFADIDHFKSFNDIHGHACGDFVLKEIATVLREQLRDIDRVARWGGEEFVLLLPGTDEDGLHNIAEKIRRHIENQKFHFEETGALSVTMTIGGTIYREGETIHECIERADQALYKGKTAGRNRVEVSPRPGLTQQES